MAARAWIDVQEERQRQQLAEGWTPEHDDQHDAGELAGAGAAYAIAAADLLHPLSQGDGDYRTQPPPSWPGDWAAEHWKAGEPRRMLVKAGALILAEIERLDRAAEARPAPVFLEDPAPAPAPVFLESMAHLPPAVWIAPNAAGWWLAGAGEEGAVRYTPVARIHVSEYRRPTPAAAPTPEPETLSDLIADLLHDADCYAEKATEYGNPESGRPERNCLEANLRAALSSARAAAPTPEPETIVDPIDRLAVAQAYAWLWAIQTEPMAPVPILDPEKAAYEARKLLLEQLTTEERARAIQAMIAWRGGA